MNKQIKIPCYIKVPTKGKYFLLQNADIYKKTQTIRQAEWEHLPARLTIKERIPQKSILSSPEWELEALEEFLALSTLFWRHFVSSALELFCCFHPLLILWVARKLLGLVIYDSQLTPLLLSASLIIFWRWRRMFLHSSTFSLAFSRCCTARKLVVSSRVPCSSELRRNWTFSFSAPATLSYFWVSLVVWETNLMQGFQTSDLGTI